MMPTAIARVLIVDYEPRVAEIMRDAVIDLGYAVCVAGNGTEALRLVPRYQPDVVLLDLSMPEMQGDIVLEHLHEADPGLPVIIVTGNADVDRARATLARGAFDYVSKPFDLEILARLIAAAVVYRG